MGTAASVRRDRALNIYRSAREREKERCNPRCETPIKNDSPIRRGGIAGNHRRKSHEFVSGRRELRRNSRLNRNRRFLRAPTVIYMHIRRHCAACTSRIYKCTRRPCVRACTRESPERSRAMRNDEITLRRVGRVGQFDEYTL